MTPTSLLLLSLLASALSLEVQESPSPTSASWSHWSCVGGTWTRSRSLTQTDGSCYGEDEESCRPDQCQEGGRCCRDNSLCNTVTRTSLWTTCTCLGIKFQHTS